MKFQRSSVRRFSVHASALLTALLLGACGGGGDDPLAGAVPRQEAAVQTTAPAPLASLADTAPAAPDPAAATTETAAAPGQSTPAAPPRSGRSLNWWGTAPLDLFTENQRCAPQPGCRIPDGDLAVWNATCVPGDMSCYVPLSTEPQVAPLPRGDEVFATETQAAQ